MHMIFLLYKQRGYELIHLTDTKFGPSRIQIAKLIFRAQIIIGWLINLARPNFQAQIAFHRSNVLKIYNILSE